MSIIQFLRILWAYRTLTLLTLGATLLGAFVAILIVPPSYEAKTRVMLNILKPDAVTGQTLQSMETKEFVTTQMELIKDYGVAGAAVDRLGWTANPEMIQEYNTVKNPDGDIRRWLAQRIIERTKVDDVPGTNIIEIAFRAPSPNDSRSMANALRDSYIDSTLQTRRREATRNAEWFTQQADREKELLDRADAAKTDYERQSGIVMEDDKTDIETARLRSLAGQSGIGPPIVASSPNANSSPAAIEMAQLDAQIAEALKVYGPNHPSLIAMRERRGTLAKLVAQDNASASKASEVAARAAAQGAGALSAAVASQTAKVIANRDKIQRLNQLQAEVNLHRDQMEKSLARAVQLRQEAAVADPGVTVLSEAVTPTSPAFPKKPLIFGGAFALGTALGLLLSLLLEFLNRRVRGAEDLEKGFDIPLLAVVANPLLAKKKRAGARSATGGSQWALPRRRAAAQA